MPKVRNETLREAMSGQRNLKVTADVVRRLKSISDLWLSMNNDPNHTVSEPDYASEFFWLVGDILRGMHLEQLTFKKVSRERVIAQSKEG
jgi:hypothetical protein